MTGCMACDVLAGRIVHLAELTPDEAGELGPLVQATSAAVVRLLEPERVYVLSLGEEVHHIHLHVIPRFRELPPSVLPLLSAAWGERSPWECSEAEAVATADALRALLAA